MNLNQTPSQMKVAVELVQIIPTDLITLEQAQKAYDLFHVIHNKPKFQIGPDKVKPRYDANRKPESISLDFFRNPFRIIYLSRWVLWICPFNELISSIGKLPISRKDNDFDGFLTSYLSKYVSEVENLHNSLPSEHNIIQLKDLKNIRGLVDSILTSVREYYRGYPDKSFKNLKSGIENYLLPDHYLENVLTTDEEDMYIDNLYKMRIGSNYTYSKKDMFHIPYEKRELVKTNRYSIPGLPCVYLGSSPLTCWEELGKPDLNTVQTSLFQVKSLKLLDISLPPEAAIDKLISYFRIFGVGNMGDTLNELSSYIVLWPLIAACSIRVKNTNASFKPEYIIPQLLLQWIRQSDYDGICYFSTKVNSYNLMTAIYYKNYALPVQEQKSEGHCEILENKFSTITDAVPWQMFQLYKGSHHALPNEGQIETQIELVKGMPILYSATDFSRLERFLINRL